MKKIGHLLLGGLGFCWILWAPPLQAQTHPYTGMVVFGDSLSDGGNLIPVVASVGERTAQYLTGWDPNFYYNYRFSNGPIWVDQLSTRLGFGNIGSLGANDGVGNISGTNFAWAGSRSGAGTHGGIFPNLQPQIGFYSSQLANSNPSLPAPATTLFALWSGANDVFAHVESADPITPAQVKDNISAAITSLYTQGGRFFVVPNLPPIGRSPGYIDDPIKGPTATAFVDAYNNLLDARLDELSGSLTGITIFKVDVHQLFVDFKNDPDAYGFTNISDTAYVRYGTPPYEPIYPPYGETRPNPDGFLYWDSAHGTTLTNSYIADAAYAQVVPEPSTLLLGLLLAGFALLRFRIKQIARGGS